jgi:VanZ family protein
MKSIKYFLPALLWAGVILILSTIGNVHAPNLLPDLLAPDKLGHAAAYLIQSALLGWGFYKTKKLLSNALIISVLSSAVLGVSLEFAQYLFFPTRFFELWDMVANVTGALLGSIFTFSLYRKRK